MKYLYVLASDDSDYYFEQALLSITSLRMRMSVAFVSLLVDDITEAGLTGKRKEIIELVDELKSIKIDERFDKKARSRWLKTSMREHITGDFLYIDCDTVIAEDLSSIDNIDADIGAVLDGHMTLSDSAVFRSKFLQDKKNENTKLGFVSVFNSNVFFIG
jgi:lipopolysaccharide biosynthesis glycosyltransferase